MAFGETLKAMLSASGIKGNQLADAIGYDSSYVSRWLTNEKLPSYKKNDALFRHIAEMIVSSCDEIERKAVIAEMELQDKVPLSDEELEAELEHILKDSYSKQKDLKAGIKSASDMRENSLVLRNVNFDTFFSLLADSIYDAAGTIGTVDIVTTSPLDYYGRSERDFIGFLSNFKNSSFSIHVSHLINSWELSENISECCRAICRAMIHKDGLDYDFFVVEEAEHDDIILTAVKGNLCIKQHGDHFSSQPYMLISKEPWMVFDAFQAFKRIKQHKRPLLEKILTSQLNNTTYFLNYMMQREYWHILNVMHPLYLSEEFNTELFYDKSHANDAMMELAFSARMHRAKKTAVIFKTALLDYIYYGRIVFLGPVLTLSPMERIRHLKELVEELKTSNRCSIVIIEDNNPMLCYNEVSQSVFISNTSGHATVYSNPSYTFLLNDTKLVDAFRVFISNLCDMPEAYVTKGQQVIDLIESGIAWLEDSLV